MVFVGFDVDTALLASIRTSAGNCYCLASLVPLVAFCLDVCSLRDVASTVILFFTQLSLPRWTLLALNSRGLIVLYTYTRKTSQSTCHGVDDEVLS